MQNPWDAVCWPSSVIGLTPCSVTSPGWAAGRWHVHGLPCCHQIRRPCSVCRPGAVTTCCLALSPFAPAWPNFCMSGVAQWSASWAHNPKVPGSKPGSATGCRSRAGSHQTWTRTASWPGPVITRHVTVASALTAQGRRLKLVAARCRQTGAGQTLVFGRHLHASRPPTTRCRLGCLGHPLSLKSVVADLCPL